MVQACILIKAKTKSVFDVVKQLEQMEEVKDAFPVFGRFDVVAFIEVESRDRVVELARKINSLEGVIRTETLLEV
ncbi:MAG TPA: Lrp/AsnC family transcriptional regulator [Candidatus Methanomethylia archaeon]|nr:Lrp/AsnC family transcriptional regulator [Candidatus Methanomethylicia archaeon]